jgi:hypothetical protein
MGEAGDRKMTALTWFLVALGSLGVLGATRVGDGPLRIVVAVAALLSLGLALVLTFRGYARPPK